MPRNPIQALVRPSAEDRATGLVLPALPPAMSATLWTGSGGRWQSR
ncbi:hypothetical protein [Actinomadura sp. HBU206391]|nr:hypothetical protein [Actinomadura sp. HBU206391]MBC6462732.1 hypothetical protein [Actinomadura sp. HBU206391]